ncbi:hypothetical protein, partial [Collinsella aerofaciens]|uniref:hypothetical protein n=1 Tax=Collinsella aerofaciens TaxID=74426 RepID=UPI002915499F
FRGMAGPRLMEELPSVRAEGALGAALGALADLWAAARDAALDMELAIEASLEDVSVNLFFTSFAKQARRSRKGGFTGCANVFSPIPVTA